MSLSRRRFLETATVSSVAAAGLSAAKSKGPGDTTLPTRMLGKTGQRVSVLGMGCGSKFLAYHDEDDAIAAIHKALDLGITYFDTAVAYGNGLSETRVGKALAGRRDSVWLTTKVDEREGDSARATIDQCLRRLQTDRIDLVHIHALTDSDDLARIEAKDGVLNALLKLKLEGVIRNVGISSHSDPEVLRTALERHPFDCTQMALNAALVGMKNGPSSMLINPAITTSFEQIALPVANRKGLGVLAMKVFAQDYLTDQAPADKLIRYSLSLPVTACVIGMPKPGMIADNVETVKAFEPMPRDEMNRMAGSLAIHHKANIDRFFHSHIDC
jgi:predicted aldo/keto reductase-like oxidoreductase